MKLKCNLCNKKEKEPFDIGDDCSYGCGGKFKPVSVKNKDACKNQVIDSSEISTKNRTKEKTND